MKWITKLELVKILFEMEQRKHNFVFFDLRVQNKEVYSKKYEGSKSVQIDL